MKKVKDFHFKKFSISQEMATHKVGTDGVLLGAWVRVGDAKRILDVGTGSGLIALMLAQRTEDSVHIDGIEIQQDDARQAKKNVEMSSWSSRVNIIGCAAQEHSGTYDLIVSNPPFFLNSWLPPKQSRSTARHTSSLPFDALLATVTRCLEPSGKFAVILPFDEAQKFLAMAERASLYPCRQCAFRSRKEKPVERLMIEFSFEPTTNPEREELVLYSDGEEWSKEYRALTGDFYLRI